MTGPLARLIGLERTEPVDADDRADLEVLNAAAELGFRLATRCLVCGQWLVAPKSVRLHIGPKCRKRAAQ
jgi:hypothetical protein